MGLNINQPAFSPEAGKTVNISASNVSANVQVRTNANAHERHCRVFNSGSVTVFIATGPTGLTASATTDMPLAAGATEIIAMAGDFAAAITSSGTSTVYFTPGEGL